MEATTLRPIAILAALLLVPLAAAAIPDPVPVVAAGNSFTPAVLAIPVGASVQWTAELLPHTVTTSADALGAARGGANDRGNNDNDADSFHIDLPQGASYTHTFNTAGTYEYFCDLHYRLGMVAVVVVS